MLDAVTMRCRRRSSCILLTSLVSVTLCAAALASKDQAGTAASEQGAAQVAEPASEPAAESAPAPLTPQVVRRSKVAFGSDVHMMAVAKGDEEASRAVAHLDAAFAEIERIAALTDATREGNDIARLNLAAGKEPVVVSAEVFALLTEAKRVAGLSRGAFDPTSAPAFALWPFATPSDDAARQPPSDDELAAVKALVGHEDLVLDAAARTAALKRASQAVRLDGIAKGYALERAAAVLEERGLKDFVIAAGGDVVLRGSHGERPWRVGIQDPRAPGHFAATTVEGGAVMTTGDYERFFRAGDARYHDVLDPRTAKPATGARSVTVFAKDAAEADALSKAVFVLGAKKGLALVRRLKGVEAVIVTDDNRVLVSRGLKKDLTWRPPTDAP